MGKILLLLVGIGIGLFIAAMMRRGGRRDLTAPPPRLDAPQTRRTGIGDAEVAALIRQGRKIEAIKRLRELTRMSLSEAKEAVEELEDRLR
ncbi:MAG TPA: hypothetical protein PKD99_11250 [Sphingopyxis sp.]|nr:hypothetical protein [Sphingopyxis sp.]HMP45673.1 hypothetical protein [Sphingopyxis sp.]HMQ17899.1 hypothetical protein [Sphingopyxis sp.]